MLIKASGNVKQTLGQKPSTTVCFCSKRRLQQLNQVITAHFAVPPYLCDQTRPYDLTAMDRDHRTSPICMPQKVVTAFNSNYLEAGSAQRSYNLLSCNARQSAHVSIQTR